MENKFYRILIFKFEKIEVDQGFSSDFFFSICQSEEHFQSGHVHPKWRWLNIAEWTEENSIICPLNLLMKQTGFEFS